MKKRNLYKIWIYAFFFLISLAFVLPFVLIVAISFSTESDLTAFGYSIIPKHFTVTAYRYLFKTPDNLINAYITTIWSSIIPTVISTLLCSVFGYALSKPYFVFKKALTKFLLFTMLFNGGLVPTYILNVKYLNLRNTPWIYLFSGLIGAWSIFIYKSFFQQLPYSLFESAKLDGAGEMRCYFSIAAPLSKAVLATYTFFGLLGRWNDFSIPLYYIDNAKLYNLQYLMQLVLQEAQLMRDMMERLGIANQADIPLETMKFAICTLAAIPMLFVFTFFQKYFSTGMTVGSVKG